MATFTNTFENGMRVDNNMHLQSNTTFRRSLGGRVMWNRQYDRAKSLEDNMKSGNSRVFAVARGNRFEISITPGYLVVGFIELLDGTYIFSTNGINSEIGWLTLNDNIDSENHVKYVVRYNDMYDPNFINNIVDRRTANQDGGDKLFFNERYYIRGISVTENELITRLYWVDGYNQERTFNTDLFFNNLGQPYHPENPVPGQFIIYPKHLSVHAMDSRMDMVPAKIKFRRRIPGQLKSGCYQLTYQYVSKNGHSSVWSELDRRVFVTDQKLDGDVDGDFNAYKSNHHNRTMGASNLMTTEGLEYELKGVDTRWDYVRVGYVYFGTYITFQESNHFDLIEIGNQSSIIVKLTKHTGTAITKGELTARYETILEAGAIAEQDNRKWLANLRLMPDLTLDLKGVTIEATNRLFKPDEAIEPNFEAVENKVSRRVDNDPITNSFVKTGTWEMTNFTGDIESYMIEDDYINYKGQQFEKLMNCYPHGETQPFAVLLIDRKGDPTFVQHIQDFTFPNIYDGENWSLTEQDPVDGSFYYKALGAIISNLNIPVKILYDKFGRLNISAIKIVRTERIPRTVGQGVLVNTVETGNGKSNTDNDYFIQPQLYFDNAYMMGAGGGEINTPGTPDGSVPPNSYVYLGALGTSYKNNNFYDSLDIARSSPGIFTFHSPDLLIDREISKEMMAGYLEHVAIVHKAYSERVDIGSAHYYTKAYRMTPMDYARYRQLIVNGRPKLGDKSRIKLAFFHTKGPLDIYKDFDPEQAGEDNPIRDFRGTAHAWLYDYSFNSSDALSLPPQPLQNQSSWHSALQPYAVIIKLSDIKTADITEANNSRTSYRIFNWNITPEGYYGDGNDPAKENSSLETRRYIDTGHMIPITPQTLDKFQKNYGANGQIESYTINGMEIYGGGHYVNPFDFSRLYPQYTDCVTFHGAYPDYSVSMIVPNESKFNLALMNGRRFAANAVMAQRTSCTGEKNQQRNGINFNQPEDWNYNDVLLLQEATKFYFPRPADIKILERRESGLAFSPKKLYGEKEDSYRQQLVFDFADAIGQFGAIQQFAQAFNSLYIIQESGFGRLKTSLQTVIPTTEGEEIYVKSGDVFGGVDYISKKYGTQHKNSVWSDDNTIGFADARMGKLIVFAQNGFQQESQDDQIDDPIMTLSIFFDRDIVHDQKNGVFVDIVAGFDNENKEAYTSFIHETNPDLSPALYDRVNEVQSKTIIYNKELGFFQGEQPYFPHIWINAGRYLLAPNNDRNRGSELWLFNHGKYGHWFGTYFKTELEFIVNAQPNVSKVFDNGRLNINLNGYERISEIIHEIEGNIHKIVVAENTGADIIRADDRIVYQENGLWYPMHEVDWDGVKERLRGTSLLVKIVIDNSQQMVDGKDITPVIVNFDTIFRTSHPIQY